MVSDRPLIAIVDDEAPVRTMLRRALRLADFEVATYANGEDFLDSLAAGPPACVVLDIHLPGLSGLDAERQLNTWNVPVPVVLITASDDATLDSAAAVAGAVRLLRKPFSTEILLDAVREALAKAAGKVDMEQTSAGGLTKG